ncbi:MAG: hypothetical protein HC906_02355 [Bacteroidales bacterium]|nr:hypothetical protein [Bacteroidales bacterium]
MSSLEKYSAKIKPDGSEGYDKTAIYPGTNWNVYYKYINTFNVKHSIQSEGGFEATRSHVYEKLMSGKNLVGTYDEFGQPAIFEEFKGQIEKESYF